MALIKCPECGNEISDKARICLKCGKPIERNNVGEENDEVDMEGVIYGINDLLNSAGSQAIVNQYFTYKTKKTEIDKSIREQENASTKKFFVWQWVFTLTLSVISFVTIGVLGRLDLLDKYVVGALMGSIIGYLFGQAVKRK